MIHHTGSTYAKAKTSNLTETVSYSDHPFIHHILDSQGGIIDFHVDSILGNNGKLTVTPPTGIKISKTADSTITDRTQSYEFEVTAPAGSYQMILEQANGTRSESTLDVYANTPADISLKHGETVYLLGLADGASVTVKELTAGKDYTVSKINGAADADGAITLTVDQHVIVPAAFENTRTPPAICRSPSSSSAPTTNTKPATPPPPLNLRSRWTPTRSMSATPLRPATRPLP